VKAFVTILFLILALCLTLSFYSFGFRANTSFFFVNYDCLVNCQPIGCSNNTSLFFIKGLIKYEDVTRNQSELKFILDDTSSYVILSMFFSYFRYFSFRTKQFKRKVGT